ncbi:MAG: hypothetical protein OSB09_00070 [Planctomycetota bacterium]|nr:hypothetical protein [Planctomycetota bacterium]
MIWQLWKPPSSPSPIGLLLPPLLLLLLLGVIGCQPTSHPALISARIDGLLEDGLGEGDQIILVLDAALELTASPRVGLMIEGATGSEQYSFHSTEDHNVLIVELESGFDHLDLINSDRSVLVSLDLGLLGLKDDLGQPLEGVVGPAILQLPVAEPAILEDARWIDSDRSSTVNREDLLVLRWNQPVHFSQTLRDRKLQISPSLIRLSVKGDQLGSSRIPARFLDGPSSRETSILLGELPFLTIDGMHEHSRSRFEGSPSAIAVTGTTILPSLDLVTDQGGGVASPVVVDLEGECAPWQDLELPPGLPALAGHSLTRLPGGKVLIAGGRALMAGSSGRALASAWIIDPLGNHQGPISMQAARADHCATLLPGVDGLLETNDDLVLITGGWDGSRARDDAEVLLFSAENSHFIPVETSAPSSARFDHSAHPIAQLNTVILVAGRLDGTLNGLIEQVEIEILDSDTGPKAISTTYQIGELRYPRHQHGSILFEDSEQPLLLLYGGYGGSLGTPHVQFDTEHCRVLDNPEAFRIRADSRTTRALLIDEPELNLPGPRRGLRLHSIGDSSSQGNRALLIAGTRREPNPDALTPFQPTECRTSYLLEQQDTKFGRIRLRWIPAGRLPVELYQPSIVGLPGGRILIAGGYDRGGLPTSEAAIYDPFSGVVERVCKPLSRESAQGEELLLAPQSVALWGGALIIAASPESRTSRALLFKSGN